MVDVPPAVVDGARVIDVVGAEGVETTVELGGIVGVPSLPVTGSLDEHAINVRKKRIATPDKSFMPNRRNGRTPSSRVSATYLEPMGR